MMNNANPAAAVVTDGPQRQRLDRMALLHRLYHRGAAVNHYIARRLRPAGIGVCVVLIVASFMGLGEQRDSTYQMFSLAFALAATGLLWAVMRRAKLRAVRLMPRHGTAGVPLRFPVEIRNDGRGVARAFLAETAPDARPPLGEFIREREPGEEERNVFDRGLAYFRWQWLMRRRRAFDGGRSVAAFEIARLGRMRVAVEITPRRRGVLLLDDLRVLLPDPLGFFQSCRRVPCEPATLIVLPQRHRVPPVELPGGAAFRIGCEANTNAIGSHGEFVGLREYRAGDPMRLIHWKSWARTGRPIVKELEDTHFPRHALVMDNFAGGAHDGAFEELVSVAASFASSIDTRESLLDLMFVEDEAHVVTAGRGVERVERLLEVLAGVGLSEAMDFRGLSNLVLSHREQLSSCLVLLLGWDEERAAFLDSLRRGGLACVLVIVGHGEKPDGAPGHWVDAHHVARDLSRMPIRPSP